MINVSKFFFLMFLNSIKERNIAWGWEKEGQANSQSSDKCPANLVSGMTN